MTDQTIECSNIHGAHVGESHSMKRIPCHKDAARSPLALNPRIVPHEFSDELQAIFHVLEHAESLANEPVDEPLTDENALDQIAWRLRHDTFGVTSMLMTVAMLKASSSFKDVVDAFTHQKLQASALRHRLQNMNLAPDRLQSLDTRVKDMVAGETAVKLLGRFLAWLSQHRKLPMFAPENLEAAKGDLLNTPCKFGCFPGGKASAWEIINSNTIHWFAFKCFKLKDS